MATIPENSNVTVVSKNERKARELVSKLGLKAVPGIIRVTFRKRNNEIVAIEKPDVYRTPGGNYVVFGEPKVDNFTQKLAAAQQQAQQSGALADASKSPEDIQADMQAAADAAVDASEQPDAAATEEDNVDAGDLSKDDIELVMQQTNVGRGAAVKALKEHNGDIVNAIMSLSK